MHTIDGWPDAIAAFITSQLAGGIARTSAYTRRQHLQHLARRVPYSPWQVTTDDLAGFLASQNWERETRRSRLTTYRAFWSWAVKCGRTLNDPTAALDKVRPGDPNPRPVPERIYLAALARADDDERLWIDLAAEHGLRRGEIAVIHAHDLVETLLGYDLVVHGKGGKLREVPLTGAMARALMDRSRRLGGYLFPGDEDGHVSARWLGKRVNRLLEGDWTIHKLRHRAATRFWVAAEGDPYVVADLMGWASLAMVRTYVKLPDDRKRRILEAASRVPSLL
ncbi:tyrosine-type recombinase/integrase [Microbacterium sp. NPDC077663]|uniref:tyrosine-type recombinase/integrase n=1 Tax=Microbacterium sp. NPDC077663 TaxID=3364189 RepID=UPI0037C74CE4